MNPLYNSAGAWRRSRFNHAAVCFINPQTGQGKALCPLHSFEVAKVTIHRGELRRQTTQSAMLMAENGSGGGGGGGSGHHLRNVSPRGLPHIPAAIAFRPYCAAPLLQFSALQQRKMHSGQRLQLIYTTETIWFVIQHRDKQLCNSSPATERQ